MPGFLASGISFLLTFFTIAWVANWIIQIRKELRNKPVLPLRVLKLAVSLTAPWAVLLCGVLLWKFHSSPELPQIVSGIVSAPIALYWLYRIDVGKKRRAPEPPNEEPGNAA